MSSGCEISLKIIIWIEEAGNIDSTKTQDSTVCEAMPGVFNAIFFADSTSDNMLYFPLFTFFIVFCQRIYTLFYDLLWKWKDRLTYEIRQDSADDIVTCSENMEQVEE